MIVEHILMRMDTGDRLFGGETIPIGTMVQQQIFGTRLAADRAAFQVYNRATARPGLHQEYQYNYQNIVTPIGVRRELQIQQKLIEIGDTITFDAILVGVSPPIPSIAITTGGLLAPPPPANTFVADSGLTATLTLPDFFPYATDRSRNVADSGTIDFTAELSNRMQGAFTALVVTPGVYEACVDLYESTARNGVYDRLLSSVGNGYPVRLSTTALAVAKWWESFHADPWNGHTTRDFLYVVMVKDVNDFVIGQLLQHFTAITPALDTPVTIPVPTPPPPPTGGGAFVQNVGHANSVTLNTTLAIPVSATVPIGELVLVRYTQDASQATPPTCADSQGNVYTLDKRGTANSQESGIFSAPITKQLTSADTITITFATSTTKKAGAADDFSGMNQTASRVDTSGALNSNPSITNPSVSTPTNNANDLLYGVVSVGGPIEDAYTEDPNGWVSLAAEGTTGGGASGNRSTNAAYQFVATASGPFAPPYAYAPTLGSARSCQGLIVAYKQA